MNKIKIALAALLVAGTASAAMAENEFDPNPANRYPAYAAPGAQPTGAYSNGVRTLQSAPVRLNQGNGQQFRDNGNGYTPAPAHAGGVG